MAARLFTPRATRYALPIPVFYRASGEATWAEGRTENISESGLLVRGDREVPPNAAVELLLTIPSNLRAPFVGTTVCEARIVRTVPADPLENRCIFAAAIVKTAPPLFVDPRRI